MRDRVYRQKHPVLLMVSAMLEPILNLPIDLEYEWVLALIAVPNSHLERHNFWVFFFQQHFLSFVFVTSLLQSQPYYVIYLLLIAFHLFCFKAPV